mmetsp:Transcript_13470/g.22916  ORF Transcript_13470/g.22916 Transcript_13470/m.22916 type:complete len:126 (-) Transcript_13470:120-497(-)
MKGQKFHYNELSQQQWSPVSVDTPHELLPACTGNNGPVDVNCKVVACTGTNGPLDGPVGSPCDKAQPATVPSYTLDPTAGSQYHTSGNLTPTSLIQLNGIPADLSAPEKVLPLESAQALHRTTYR